MNEREGDGREGGGRGRGEGMGPRLCVYERETGVRGNGTKETAEVIDNKRIRSEMKDQLENV